MKSTTTTTPNLQDFYRPNEMTPTIHNDISHTNKIEAKKASTNSNKLTAANKWASGKYCYFNDTCYTAAETMHSRDNKVVPRTTIPYPCFELNKTKLPISNS